MGRPRTFDREQALRKAMRLFWRKGFSATSTDALATELAIGQQSLYHAFGSKRGLYLEALERYQEESTAAHIARLDEPASPVAGLRALLRGLAVPDDETRRLGCLGVVSVNEFGTGDAELDRMRATTGRRLFEAVAARLDQARAAGEIDEAVDPATAAHSVLTAMLGLQVSARGGADVASMHAVADFTIDRLSAARAAPAHP